MAPSRKQQFRDPKKDIRNFCQSIKKKLDTDLKLLDDFIKFLERYDQQDASTQTIPDTVTINFGDLDFGNLDGSHTLLA